jgi:hypothetical protein
MSKRALVFMAMGDPVSVMMITRVMMLRITGIEGRALGKQECRPYKKFEERAHEGPSSLYRKRGGEVWIRKASLCCAPIVGQRIVSRCRR